MPFIRQCVRGVTLFTRMRHIYAVDTTALSCNEANTSDHKSTSQIEYHIEQVTRLITLLNHDTMISDSGKDYSLHPPRGEIGTQT